MGTPARPVHQVGQEWPTYGEFQQAFLARCTKEAICSGGDIVTCPSTSATRNRLLRRFLFSRRIAFFRLCLFNLGLIGFGFVCFYFIRG